MIANHIKVGQYLVVVSQRFLVLVFNSVGRFARFNHRVDSFLDVSHVSGNLFDQRRIQNGQLGYFGLGINGFDFVQIVQEHRLIACSHRNDVIYGQVAQHTRFDLDFLCVGFPLYLVAGM